MSLEEIKANAGAIVVAIGAGALALPKLLNVFKTDRLDSKALERLDKAEKKIEALSTKVHEHAIALTQAQMMIIRLHSLLKQHDAPIPEPVEKYVQELHERVSTFGMEKE